MERQVRYDALDLDCDDGVTGKRGKFSDMFKRSSKSTEPSVSGQDNFSVYSDLSASSDSLSDNSNKEKGGLFRGMKKKTSKPAREDTPTQFQDPLSTPGDFSAENDIHSDNNNLKEKGGMFSGVFRRSPKPSPKPLGSRTQSQDNLDNLSSHSDLSGSKDNLTEKTSKGGGMMSKILRNPFSSSAQDQDRTELTTEGSGELSKAQQDNLSVHSALSSSSDSLTERAPKEKTGGGMFKWSSKPSQPSAPTPDNLSVGGDLSASNDSLSENNRPKEKGGMFSGVFRRSPKPAGSRTQSQEDLDRVSAHSDLTGSRDNLSEKTSRSRLAGAMTKLNPFHSAGPKQEKEAESDGQDPAAAAEKQPNHKQNAVVGALSKMNPFRSAPKKDAEESESQRDDHKEEEKTKVVRSSNPVWQGRMERGGSPAEVPPRPSEEELKGTATRADMKRRENEDRQADRNERRERERASGTPGVPPRPAEEELNRPDKRGQRKHKKGNQEQSDDEGVKEGESLSSAGQKGEEEEVTNPADGKAAKMKKPKRHNPFMPRVAAKGKTLQKKTDSQQGTTDSAENEGGKKSLFDQLEELRVDPTDPEDQDVENLMDWWNTVENWDDLPQEEDMTEKEEAKAFAVTAEKVQKGIRVFNKLFSERAESLWQHVIDLNAIADNLDRFNKRTKIAQITGGSTSAIGGVATIVGLALAPVTMGTSLIVTAVGLGVATSGGLTSAGAGISNQVNNSMDRKKVERIVEDYQEKMADINKCMKFIKQGIENLRKFDLLKMKKHAYNRDFPGLNNIYEDGAMVGKALLINANEIMRVVQIANVAGSTAARAVQIASMATGVLTGLFVGMDIYFVAKDSKELKKGAKSEFAAKIREVASQLHEGLVELNGIRDELQSANPPDSANPESTDKANFFNYDDDDDDDEIALFKKKNKMAAELDTEHSGKDGDKDSKA